MDIVYGIVGFIVFIFGILVIIASYKTLSYRKKKAFRFALALGLPERLGDTTKESSNPFGELDIWNKSDYPELTEQLKKRWNIDVERDKGLKGAALRLRLGEFWSSGLMSKYGFTQSRFEQHHEKDFIAFYTASFVELARKGVALDLISEEEAWGLLLLNAQRAQSIFASWREYTDCYLKGYLASLEGQDKRQKHDTLALKIDAEYQQKFSEWQVLDWREQRILADMKVL